MFTSHSKTWRKAWHFLKPYDFIQTPGTCPSDSCATCWWVNLLHWMSLEKDRNNALTVPWRLLERKCQPTAYAGYWVCRHCSREGTRRAQASAYKDEARQKWILADGWMGRSILSLCNGLASHTEAQSRVYFWETKKWTHTVLGMHCFCHGQNGSIIQHSRSKAEHRCVCCSVVYRKMFSWVTHWRSWFTNHVQSRDDTVGCSTFLL